MIPRLSPELGGLAEPSLAQRFAEELVVDMVRKHVDVIGLLELERDVLEALGGAPPVRGTDVPATPLSVLAAALLDHAFQRIEHEWREGRMLSRDDDCPCCVVERQAAQRRKGTAS